MTPLNISWTQPDKEADSDAGRANYFFSSAAILIDGDESRSKEGNGNKVSPCRGNADDGAELEPSFAAKIDSLSRECASKQSSSRLKTA